MPATTKSRLGNDPFKGSEDKIDKLFSSTSNKQREKKKEESLKRATFFVDPKYIEKIKEVAYWERKKLYEVLDEALSEYFANKKIQK